MQPSSCHAYLFDQYHLLLLIMTVQPQPCCYCRIRTLLLSAQHARAEASNTNSASTNSSVPHQVDPLAIFLLTWRVGRYTTMLSTVSSLFAKDSPLRSLAPARVYQSCHRQPCLTSFLKWSHTQSGQRWFLLQNTAPPSWTHNLSLSHRLRIPLIPLAFLLSLLSLLNFLRILPEKPYPSVAVSQLRAELLYFQPLLGYSF